MNARTSEGLVLSAGLHALIAAVLWLGYITREETAEMVSTLVMVGGRNESPGAASPQRDLSPSQPAVSSTDAEKNLAEAMRRSRERKAAQLAQEARLRQMAEAKAAAEARVASAPAISSKPDRQITKELFDRQNATPRNTSAGARAANVAHVDTDTLVRDLQAGARDDGGSQNAATARAESDAARTYADLVGAQIRAALDERPGIIAGLVVEVEIHILPNGAVRDIRILRTSGNTAFDDAVREAMAGLNLPARPRDLAEVQRFPIRSRRD